MIVLGAGSSAGGRRSVGTFRIGIIVSAVISVVLIGEVAVRAVPAGGSTIVVRECYGILAGRAWWSEETGRCLVR